MDHPSNVSGQEPQTTLRDLPAAAGGWDEDQLPLILPQDQNRRWQQGERVLVEDYLAVLPGLGRMEEVVVDLIHNEFLLRQQRRESPRPAEYLRRFPQFRERLDGLLAVELLLEGDRGDPDGLAPERENKPDP